MTWDDRMKYHEAKQARDRHEAYCRADSLVLDHFAKGFMGLTPDEVKGTLAWRAAKDDFDRHFAQLRAFNQWFVKKFKRQIQAERSARAA